MGHIESSAFVDFLFFLFSFKLLTLSKTPPLLYQLDQPFSNPITKKNQLESPPPSPPLSLKSPKLVKSKKNLISYQLGDPETGVMDQILCWIFICNAISNRARSILPPPSNQRKKKFETRMFYEKGQKVICLIGFLVKGR